MDGLPTTAINTTQGTIVPPHAQTHEVDGDDPVLGPIRLLGITSISNSVNIHSVGYVVTGLEITAFTRGGTVEVEVSGQRVAVGNTGASSVATIASRLTVDSLASYQDLFDFSQNVVSTGTNTVSINTSSVLKWYITNLPAGPHTFRILASDLNNGSLAVYSNNTTVFMVVREVLPFRRA